MDDYCGLRRSQLRAMSVLAFVACIWTPSLALANNNAGLRTIPLHISNHINQAVDLYVLIFGQINRDNGLGFHVGDKVYVTNSQGDVAVTPAIPGNAPISLSIKVGMGTENDLTLPKLSAIRIYSSLGPLLVQNGGVAGNQLGAPNVEDPNDPNFNTQFDSIETTWEPQPAIPNHPEITTNLGTNVTEVDLFGLVQQYTVEGILPVIFQPGALTAGFLSTARRPTLFNTLQSFGPPWSNLIVGNNGARVRAISPNHAIHATIPPLNGLFPANQLDAYITQVFARYISAPPIVATVFPVPNVTYNFTGLTQGGELVFSDPNKGGAIFSLLKPTTFNAYEGSFPLGSVKPGGSLCPDPPPPLSAACLAYKAVSASLQGALMRTTLLVNNSLDDPLVVPGATGCVKSQFYVNPPVNMYAKLWHDAGIGGKAYGFGFDDTCDQSSFQLIFNPTRLTITLLGNRP